MRVGVTEGERNRGSLVPTAVMLGGLLIGVSILAMSGCDTVAQIAFPERRFQEIRPIGVMPTGGQCDGVGNRGSLRMVLMANDGTPIKPGEDLSLASVDLRAQDLSWSDGRLYTFPDETCGSGECPPAFTCTESTTGVEELGNRCMNTTALGVPSDPVFVGNEPTSQALAVVLSNEGRWRGWLPDDLGTYFEANPDGTAVAGASADIGLDDGRAGDRPGERYGALDQARQVWQNLVNNVVEPQGRQAFFGLWTFAETSAETTSHVGQLSSPEQPSVWTRQPLRVAQAIRQAEDTNPQRTRADVYARLQDILDEGFGPDSQVAAAVQNVEDRHLVLIVGGPNERPRPTLGYQEVVSAAQDLGVTISVIQVDPAMDKDLLRDDPRYYETAASCSSDADCKNFEECRQVQLWCNASSAQSCNDVAFPANPDNQYCVPARDENGRVGPIEDYQLLACETGGSYSYIPTVTNNLLFSRLAGQVMWQEAGWEVEIDINESGSLIPGEPAALQGALQITQGQTQSYNFSQRGSVLGTPGDPSSWDTRPVFFKAP